MYLAMDFGEPQVVDEVSLDHAAGSGPKVEVDVLSGRGLRRAAILALKSKGITYLMVRNTDFFRNEACVRMSSAPNAHLFT
jgi:hypothetical protein